MHAERLRKHRLALIIPQYISCSLPIWHRLAIALQSIKTAYSTYNRAIVHVLGGYVVGRREAEDCM
jgi:hypothetical protein